MMWFVKSRRAQSDADYETWIEGGVVPTLNSFDCGDTRATVLIIDGTRVDDVRVYDDEITPCLKSRMGTGGNNVPFVAFATNQRSEVRDIGDIAVALSAEPGTNQQTYIAQETDMNEPVMLNFQGSKGNSVTTEDGISFSLNAMHGHDVHVVAQETDMTDVNGSDIAATLRGFGHGWQGQHNSTNAVVQETTHDVIGTIQARSYKGPNHENARDGQLVIQGKPTMQVRRLTVIECERLMGWEDNHTLPRADGKTNSDTTRYKMCGNGVASPVAEWIGQQIMAVHRES